ncbi:MAG: DUF1445 domain-containing protein [Chloroflexota bacterium]|nr:DUF1445 domain-containing protein [Chloroflexota bacterium]
MDKKKYTDEQVGAMTPVEFRNIVRKGEWRAPSERACVGYWKANLVVLPKDWAFDFMLYAQRNPRPCWIGAATDPGDPHPRQVAKDADLRTDLPRYRVFKDGEVIDEPTDIMKYWRDDLVAFLIGPLPNTLWLYRSANVRYIMIGAYTSTLPCVPAARLHGNMSITCVIFKTTQDAVRSIQIASRYPDGHGTPVYSGMENLAGIGIKDLYNPDVIRLADVDNIQHPEMVGHGYDLKPGEVALWFANGVTPQLAALESKVPFMITHKAGHFFVSDKRCEEWAIL